jgi:transposase
MGLPSLHEQKATSPQIHALVTQNLLDEEMKGVSVWFGAGGLRKIVHLPLPAEDRAHMARCLEQLELLARQEESMQVELAQVARAHNEIQLLMTIPGVNFYSAVGIFAEIGDIHRFPDKQHLASYAGVVPKADNSGTRVGQNRPVKPGNMALKFFLCIAVKSMVTSGQKTAVAEFYRKKVANRPSQQATVAAARKLSGEIWKMLTFGVPYHEEDAALTGRKSRTMRKVAEESIPEITPEALDALAERVIGKAETLNHLAEEAGDDQLEVHNAS